ncbi:hypothetical protein G7Y31_00295 [Corynebacterium lizhenjunii]|uniref:Uncharacterized protein n=1 Tax=Corynebacterium lizhenjunii TaxID=2709394 RepID=A0A7T0PAM3_9CORY|nr:hypothetical protein [Corynebacterium lizhenjunii]QPK79216.1 hypothetical protein G7Y31_00295 [Corynebacterium lizhenjunii]
MQYTWCFFTEFVCRYDQLHEAKQRHQKCVDGLREKYHVHFASEQARQQGAKEPLFSLLLAEIFGNNVDISPQVREEYSTFCFVTVVDVPHDPEAEEDEFRIVADLLEIDFEPGFPAKFPSRARGIIVSPGGHEIKGCEYQ